MYAQMHEHVHTAGGAYVCVYARVKVCAWAYVGGEMAKGPIGNATVGGVHGVLLTLGGEHS